MRTLFRAGIVVAVALFLSGCDGQGNGNEDRAAETGSKEAPGETRMDSLVAEIKRTPNNPTLYMERAKEYVNLNKHDFAKNDLKRAIKLDSANANYYVLLSTLEFRDKNPDESLKLLKKAVDIAPNHIGANLKLGEMAMYTKNYKKAFEHLNTVLKEDVHNAEAYFLKGMVYKFVKDTAKAVSSFQTCVEQDPDYYNAYLQLGMIHAGVNDDMAMAYYNNALDIRPTSLEALYNKAMYLQSTERLTRADSLYDKILSLDSTYYIAYYNKGFLRLVYTEDYDSAITLFNKAIKFDDEYFEAYYNRGYAYELKGDDHQALENYKRALKIKPDFTLAAQGVSRVEG